MTRTECPLYGDLTRLNVDALEFAFNVCQKRRTQPDWNTAFLLIQEELKDRWENQGGKEEFQAMLDREFGNRA